MPAGMVHSRPVTQKRQHPVHHLQDLFAVVAGVAFVLSIEKVVDTSAHGIPIHWGAVPLFVAFGVTALTYFHDSAVYLDLIYVEKELGNMRPARGLADLMTGSMYLFILIALSIGIDRPMYFVVTLAILLGTGVVRILVTWRLSRRMLAIERMFLSTSAVALVVLVGSAFALDALAADATRDTWLKGIALVVAVARTSIQYVLAYETYFPSDL